MGRLPRSRKGTTVEHYEVTCPCGVEHSIRVPNDRDLPLTFTCLACGRVLDWLLGFPHQPYPQHDTRRTPVVQAGVQHY